MKAAGVNKSGVRQLNETGKIFDAEPEQPQQETSPQKPPERFRHHVYVYYKGQDGGAFFRVGEFTFESFPPDFSPLVHFLIAQKFVDEFTWRIPIKGRPGHFINHIVKRKTAEGVSGAEAAAQ